jgi:predicted metalloprotease
MMAGFRFSRAKTSGSFNTGIFLHVIITIIIVIVVIVFSIGDVIQLLLSNTGVYS